MTASGWGHDYHGRGCHPPWFSLVPRLLHSVFEHLLCASQARSGDQEPMC